MSENEGKVVARRGTKTGWLLVGITCMCCSMHHNFVSFFQDYFKETFDGTVFIYIVMCTSKVV